jgi:hypothetical protein
MKLYCHYTDEIKKNSKIVSFYPDGSGASLFSRDKQGVIRCHEGEVLYPEWFIDANHCFFAYLPNKFELWYEKK